VGTGEILDLGVVDSRQVKGSTTKRVSNPQLLFRRISELNPRTLGVDIDYDGIETLRESGYQVECADAETMNLGRKFRVIIAGETIEHLENPGRFLRNMTRHLDENGVLVISTPNPFYAKQRHKIWWHRRPQVHSDHTCWFDPVTLDQLLRRTGWEPFESYWIQPKGNLLKTWVRLFRPYFSHSFMMLARKQSPGETVPS
jgi:SAM-dependent methyltransferase